MPHTGSVAVAAGSLPAFPEQQPPLMAGTTTTGSGDEQHPLTGAGATAPGRGVAADEQQDAEAAGSAEGLGFGSPLAVHAQLPASLV